MATITIDSFLAALRGHESSGNYKATSSSSSASGAYQYLDSTWNHYGGYARAWQAPPATQDERARADVTARLQAYNGNWGKVAASWFAGPGWVAQHPDYSTWDVNPAPGTKNPTVLSYVNDVIKRASGGGGGVIGTVTGVVKGGVDITKAAVTGVAKDAFTGWANDAYKLGVTVLLLGGGVALIGVGVVRLAGSSKTVQTVRQDAPMLAAAAV